MKIAINQDDIFDDDGALTANFLLARGYCCGNKCRHCPYEPKHAGQESRSPGSVTHPLIGPQEKIAEPMDTDENAS